MKSSFEKKQNTHLEHPEDVVFMQENGTKHIQKIFANILNKLLGFDENDISITIKYDGAPAVIYGQDRQTGKNFIGTKGVFAKSPRKAYSLEDINELWKGELASKLSSLREEIKNIEFNNIIQGDLLYVSGNNDLNKITIDGQEYITFRPNTIMYAIEKDSTTADKIGESKLGLVNHTLYTNGEGDDLVTENNLPNIALPDTIRSPKLNPSISFDEKTREELSILSQDIDKFKRPAVSDLFEAFKLLENISKKPFKVEIETKSKKFSPYTPSIIPIVENYIIYTNKCIRQGKNELKADEIYEDFSSYYLGLYPEKIKKLTRQRDIICYERGQRIMSIALKKYKQLCINAISTQKQIIDFKYKIMDILSASSSDNLKCFLPQGDKYITTGHEGYVVRDFNLGAAIKLVDRNSFSRANFIEPKLWSSKIPGIDSDKNKSILMLFARMNPPTKKHIEILRQMIQTAEKSGSDYIFFLTNTQDQNNPLSQELKSRIIKSAIPGINITNCNQEISSLYDAIQYISEKGYKKIGIIGGSDRMDTISEIQQKKDIYGFNEVLGINMGDRKQGEDISNLENMSASKVREFAKKGYYKMFVKCFDSQIPKKIIREAYNYIRKHNK